MAEAKMESELAGLRYTLGLEKDTAVAVVPAKCKMPLLQRSKTQSRMLKRLAGGWQATSQRR